MEGTVEEKDCIGKVSDFDYLIITFTRDFDISLLKVSFYQRAVKSLLVLYSFPQIQLAFTAS